jgi:hypothetical protein
METTVFTDPARIGPGYWFIIHTRAVAATTDVNKQLYINFINELCDQFPCAQCQTHFRRFIDTHPFATYWNLRDSQGRDIGFFRWSWELHNVVNRTLNKYSPSLMEAYEYYSHIVPCENCVKESNTDLDSGPDVSLPLPNVLVQYLQTGQGQLKPLK